jgi:HK97 family phage major capsid protein
MDPDEVLQEAIQEIKNIGENVGTMRTNLEARMDDIEKKVNRGKLGGNGNRSADADAEYKALGKFVRNGDDAELKTMSVGSDPDGGYLTLPVMSPTMTKKLFDQTPLRQMARVETITTGDAWEEPIDASDIDATWVGEMDTRTPGQTPQVGMLRVPVQEICALQPITQRLLDDSGFDIGGWVQGKITDKFARTEGTAFVGGDGFKKPRGFLSHNIVVTSDATRKWGDLQYIPSGDAEEIGADALRSLVWGVRAPYRADSQWLMNSTTASLLDKLKNGQGDYLWRNGMTAGAPDELLGYPVQFSEDMPDVGSNAYPIAFGNWKLGYLIVEKVGLKLLRDPFTNKPMVQFYAYRRVGGDVANSEAIKLLKVAAS